MTLTAKVLLAYLVTAFVVFAWMFRLDISGGSGGAAVINDRWLGTVQICSMGSGGQPSLCFPLYPAPSKLN